MLQIGTKIVLFQFNYRFIRFEFFSNLFKWYIHSLHVFLGNVSNQSNDLLTIHFEEFYDLFKDTDCNELLSKYIELNGELILIDPIKINNRLIRLLCKYPYCLINNQFINSLQNTMTMFDNDRCNKILIYRVLNVFCNEIKNLKWSTF